MADRQTDKHRATAYTALAKRRAGNRMMIPIADTTNETRGHWTGSFTGVSIMLRARDLTCSSAYYFSLTNV